MPGELDYTTWSPEDYEAARARYQESCQAITEARASGQHQRASDLARGILPLEDALNDYEDAQREAEHG